MYDEKRKHSQKFNMHSNPKWEENFLIYLIWVLVWRRDVLCAIDCVFAYIQHTDAIAVNSKKKLFSLVFFYVFLLDTGKKKEKSTQKMETK